LASDSIHDPPRSLCVTVARLCGIAPSAPIGGCDPPQPVGIAAAAQILSAQLLKTRNLICLAPCFVNATQLKNVSA
jgi:hypothetical protein